MYAGQIMMLAGAVMIGLSVAAMSVLAVVFSRNKKKLMKKIYGEIQDE